MYWLTNLAAPYRIPVWDVLAERTPLTVGVLADNEWNRDWQGLAEARPYLRKLQVRCFGAQSGHATVVLEPVRALARGRDIVVLAGWHSPAYWQIRYASRREKVPTVGFYESTIESHRYQRGAIARARASFYRSLDSVIVPGVAAGDAVRAMGVPGSRIVTTFNCVDNEYVAGIAARTRRVAGETFKFSYVGQLIKRKNVGSLLSALSKLVGAGVRAELHVVGGGPLAQTLAETTRELGINESVIWYGPMPYETTLEVMSGTQALVLPSQQEVWGLVVNEALAAGLSVVVSNSSGCAPSIAHMAGVRIADPQPDDIYKAMLHTIEHWPGWLAAPEIAIAASPQKFASDVLRAVDVAKAQRSPT